MGAHTMDGTHTRARSEHNEHVVYPRCRRCDETIFPEDALDSGHEGCCGIGCVKGIESGSCCCDRLYRKRPCAAGEC